MDEPLVSTEWLADHLGAVRVVDVRDAWEYDGIGHVPGAVNLPFDRFRAEDGDAGEARPGAGPDEDAVGRLPGVAVVEDLFSEAGIDPDDRLVFYDDTHGVFAARALVTAWLYGHDRVSLLDGDYSAWNRTNETATDAPAPEPTDYVARPREETPLIDREEVERALETDAVFLDTRDDWEYEEGHLPGALNLDWRDLVDDESRGVRPREELEDVLGAYGVSQDRRVVLYCNTARRISHTYVVLRHLGYDRVDFYEGSLTEWTAAGGDLERGS